MTGQDPGPSDTEVIGRIRDGDADAFRFLVERYQGRAYRVALRVLRDEEAARDAVQEAFLKAYTALDRFEGRSKFFTWFYRMVMNQCLDQKRRDRSDRNVEWEDGGLVENALESSTAPPPEVDGVRFAPAAAVMRKELRERINQAISELPDQARETLVLREVEGLSYAEISKALEIPKGTVMSRLYYARQRVQELLIEAGVAAAPQGEKK